MVGVPSAAPAVGIGTFSAMARQCSRPGCAAAASATMTYDYRSRTAWLDDLAHEPDPNNYDLCPAHADRLAVPRGWERMDRRVTAVRPLFARIAV
jgi:hypothetical protein